MPNVAIWPAHHQPLRRIPRCQRSFALDGESSERGEKEKQAEYEQDNARNLSENRKQGRPNFGNRVASSCQPHRDYQRYDKWQRHNRSQVPQP